MITSTPDGAQLYVDGTYVGTTPHLLRDSKVAFSSTHLRLERNGYESLYTTITKDSNPQAGPIIGGFFFVFPWLWALGYDDNHHFTLVRAPLTDPGMMIEQTTSKAQRLMHLKVLLDEGILTQEEFDREKRKILDE